MSVPRVTLVGFMAAGKSTVGRELARRLALPFVDLDALIEQAAGCDLPTIFERQGEQGFRALERAALQQALAASAGVLATGGGAPADPRGRASMRASSTVVWLDARFETARERMLEEGERRRPLIAHLGWRGLAALYSARRIDYAAAAHLRVAAEGRSPAQIARGIQSTLRAMARENGA